MDTNELLSATCELNILTNTCTNNFVVANDEITKVNKKTPYFIIQNTGDSNSPGYHWILWSKLNSSDILIFFDSFSEPPDYYKLNLPFHVKTLIQRSKFQI